MNSTPVVFFKIDLLFHGTDSTLGMVDFWLWRMSSLQSLILELDNVNQLENPLGPAWRVSSCVDVREHSRTGVTTAVHWCHHCSAPVSPLLPFLLFFNPLRFSHVLVSGSLPLSTDALMMPTNRHHIMFNSCQMYVSLQFNPHNQQSLFDTLLMRFFTF